MTVELLKTGSTICAGDRNKIAEERDLIRKNRHIGFTTEVSGNWDTINTIYENALQRIRTDFPHVDDLTMLGGHSSHSYQTGTNLYFVYDYDVKDCKPEEEITKYHIPLNALIVEETLKLGGSMVHHHGIGKYRTPLDQDRARFGLLYFKRLKGPVRSCRHHERRDHLSPGRMKTIVLLQNHGRLRKAVREGLDLG